MLIEGEIARTDKCSMTFGVMSEDDILLTATTTDSNEDPNVGSPYCADIYPQSCSIFRYGRS